MKMLVITSSPQGSTAKLSYSFVDEATAQDCTVTTIDLNKRKVAPCIGCGACQNNAEIYCVQSDDALEIAEAIMANDVTIFATAIYSWYCTAEMKALMDRLVYMMNKYYGSVPRTSLWERKRVGLITTSGYSEANGAIVFEDGFRRWCKHSRLTYKGIYAVQEKNLEAAAPKEFVDFLTENESGVFTNFETINRNDNNRIISVDDAINIAMSNDVLDKYPLHNKEYLRKRAAEQRTKEQEKVSVDKENCKHRVNLSKGGTYRLFIPFTPAFRCENCGGDIVFIRGFRRGLFVAKIALAILLAVIFIIALPHLKGAIVMSVILFILGWFILNYIVTFIFSKIAKYELRELP